MYYTIRDINKKQTRKRQKETVSGYYACGYIRHIYGLRGSSERGSVEAWKSRYGPVGIDLDRFVSIAVP
ncbi:MAG: hypothetical protein J5685_07155, partial [Clostridiales bacterium]|nr:hypothetical protein [Clostridiales bacterium]